LEELEGPMIRARAKRINGGLEKMVAALFRSRISLDLEKPMMIKSKPQKLQVKSQRVILFDSKSSNEDKIPLSAVIQKESQTKKKQDLIPPRKSQRQLAIPTQPNLLMLNFLQ